MVFPAPAAALIAISAGAMGYRMGSVAAARLQLPAQPVASACTAVPGSRLLLRPCTNRRASPPPSWGARGSCLQWPGRSG